MTSKIKTTSKMKMGFKNEDDLKNEQNLKNKDDLKKDFESKKFVAPNKIFTARQDNPNWLRAGDMTGAPRTNQECFDAQ